MGAKSRALMAADAASLEARKAAHLGPTAPPCVVCNAASKGEVYVNGRDWQPVCSQLRCAVTASGESNFYAASYAEWRPGKYRNQNDLQSEHGRVYDGD